MRVNYSFRVLILALLIQTLYFAQLVGADEFRSRMVGGQFTRLDSGPVALVMTSSFSCSGILVGSREVLTAAHCVADPGPNSDYRIIVGEDLYYVEARYYHSWYNPGGSAELNAPFDLGILILSRPVAKAAPIPVLYSDLVTSGESASIYGYGTNELSGLPGRYPWENAKVGQMIVTEANGGLISSVHHLGGASTCHGDSGGPAIQSLGGYFAVIGTLSIGINPVIDGYCYLFGDGSFSYVDLQSPSSTSFLLNFPGIQFISGYRIYVHSISTSMIPSLKGLLKVKTNSSLIKKAKQIAKSMSALLPYADGARATLIRNAGKNLKSAQKSKSLPTGLKLIRKAIKLVEELNEMGVG